MTDAEKKLWRMLRLHQLEAYKFRRQVPIGRYIADFVCHEARLVIEVDGGQHDRFSKQEVDRTGFLQSQGYRLLRSWNNDVLANPEGVYATIADDLRRHHPHPTLPHQGRGLNAFMT
jgi:adenine-specific DNA-methyltransferase